MTPLPLIDLRPGYRITRVIRGGWQLAGGHGPVDRAEAVADMMAFAEAGILTFDCADIYTGVEELIGAFRTAWADRHGQAALAGLHVHTKLVPDLSMLATCDRAYVRGIVETSLKRLRMDRLDLVQFHWWDYAVPRYLDVLGWLKDLQAEGKIAQIGATNFDTPRVREILDAGIPLMSMQVQYSLLDRRPE
ncbi:MAG: aldo/keto reductase, partial [Fuscovulum sp.]|nr:aldo/keto reductase [Fuscovulum sp.]